MGIRFRCHQCGHELHVKDFQGGKRSRCPECETKFRIPTESAERSIPLDGSLSASGDSAVQASASGASSAISNAAVGRSTGTIAGKGTSAKSTVIKPTGNQLGSADRSALNDDADEPQDALADESTFANQTEWNSEHVAAPAPAPLRAIIEAPDANWYVRPPAGGQYGPAPASIFSEWITESRVTRDSLVWRDGWPQWLLASEVFSDFFGSGVASSALVEPTIPAPAIIPAAAPAHTHLSGTAQEQHTAPEFLSPGFGNSSSLSDRTLAARKRKRKQNYMIMIAVLATISIGLVVALVVVLMQNA